MRTPKWQIVKNRNETIEFNVASYANDLPPCADCPYLSILQLPPSAGSTPKKSHRKNNASLYKW